MVQPDESAGQTGSATPHVVIVDDDADILDVLTLLFKEEGFNTSACQSAEEALDTLRTAPVDLLITDLRLGETGGLDLLRDTREIAGPLPGVILLTAARESTLASNALLREVGARIINKPFDIDLLISSAHELVGQRGKESRRP